MLSHRPTLADRDLCFIDIETTGARFGFHEIIEIAAIRTDGRGIAVRGQWQTRVLPEHPERITDVAAKLTGFSIDRWRNAAPNSADLWARFAEFAKMSIPVCHNPHFDRAFITLAAENAGVNDLGVNYHWLGTQSLAWPLFLRGQLSGIELRTLCADLGIESEPEVHRALTGAETCRVVYVALMRAHGVQ